jgi:hypothetical protein
MRVLPAIAAATMIAGATVAAAEARPPALTSVHVGACQLSPTSTDRAATFVSTMTAAPGSDRMWMRFRLRARAPGSRTAQVRTPALSAWRKSRPGVDTFTYSQTVNGLSPTSMYWMAVDYRWLDAAGRVVAGATRYSGVCSELGPLNAVRISRVSAHRGDQGTVHYQFALTNTGRDELRNVKARLYVDRTAGAVATVDVLAPGSSQMVAVDGPACGRSLHLVLQEDARIRRSVLGWHCPAVQ